MLCSMIGYATCPPLIGNALRFGIEDKIGVEITNDPYCEMAEFEIL